MGKSLPRTIVDAQLAGWQNVEIICKPCGREVTIPLAGVSRHGPDLVGYAAKLRCKSCGAIPTSVRLHRRLITVDGGEIVTGPIAGSYGRD